MIVSIKQIRLSYNTPTVKSTNETLLLTPVLLFCASNQELLNQNPEQIARDKIDSDLIRSGWLVQDRSKINLSAGLGVAVREYQTDIGPADYVLFVDQKAVGIIEAKRAEEGVHLTMHEDQSEGYASAKLKYLNNQKLPFVYESSLQQAETLR